MASKFHFSGTRDFNELKTLIDLTKNHFTKLTLEATVVTGFEKVARDECIEVFGQNTVVCANVGRIYFNTKFDNYLNYRSLQCIDRINILAGCTQLSLGGKPEDKKEDLKKIEHAVNFFDWDKVLTIWKEVFSFYGNVYPTREEYNNAVSIENKTEFKSSLKCENDTNDKIIFHSKNLNFEKTELEHALDSVVSDSEDDDEKKTNNNQVKFSESLKIPRFRVTCNRVGTDHSFSSPEAATVFGGKLQDKFNWIVDLSNYDLEIILEIINENVYAGVSLSKMSNHFKNITYFGPTTLRATVCANMMRLCEVKPGDVVIDPMCGGGSIPIQGCSMYPSIFFLGGDENEKAVNRTKCNVDSYGENLKIDTIKWDATHLPLRTNTVDVFVSDFPFGKRCGSKNNNKYLYKCALNELARVLNLKTGRCVILTADKTSLNLAFRLTRSFWKQIQCLKINIGGLNACCYVLKRTEEKYCLKLSRKERRILAQKEWIKKKELEKLSKES